MDSYINFLIFVALFVGIVCLCYWDYLRRTSTDEWVFSEVRRRLMRGHRGIGTAMDIASIVQARRNKKGIYFVIGILSMII